MTGPIFVSYSHTDRAFVEKLADHLRGFGIDPWYDYGIVPGERFASVIQNQIDRCAGFVVVLTPEAVASEWVGREISYAMVKRKPVLPIMLTQCVPPIELIDRHHHDVTGGAMVSDQFVEVLRRLTDDDGPAAQPPDPWSPGRSAVAEALGPGARVARRSATSSDHDWVYGVLLLRFETSALRTSLRYADGLAWELVDRIRFLTDASSFASQGTVYLRSLGTAIQVADIRFRAVGLSRDPTHGPSGDDYAFELGLPFDREAARTHATDFAQVFTATAGLGTVNAISQGIVKNHRDQETPFANLLVRDMRQFNARTRGLRDALHTAWRSARELVDDIEAIAIDVTSLDLSRLRLSGPEVLTGFVWSESTIWPDGFPPPVPSSVEIRPGIYQVA